MLRAVFFDWLNTLVHPEIERHDIYQQTYRQLGIELKIPDIIRGILHAEEQLPEGTPIRWRKTQPPDIYLRYQRLVLKESGCQPASDLIMRAIDRLHRTSNEIPFVRYDDVLPTFDILKCHGLRLGLITNMPQSMLVVVTELGLDRYFDAVVTSGEIGVSKPDPAIFRAALERMQISASEAAYVGDQYGTDVLGARRVGIKPILIDRLGMEEELLDCPCIASLTELPECLGLL